MQKNIILCIILALILSGCAKSGAELVLVDANDRSEVSSEAAFAGEESVDTAGRDLPLPETQVRDSEEDEKEPSVIYVYVCGAVKNAGVYELPEGSRIIDAVEASGGFSEAADETYVNLAATLGDGVKLLIPTREETGDPEVGKQIQSFDLGSDASLENVGDSSGSGLININTASKDELTAIPGIGSSTAQKIVTYREENGSFKSVEDIMNVSGIKDKLFSKIRDYITV